MYSPVGPTSSAMRYSPARCRRSAADASEPSGSGGAIRGTTPIPSTEARLSRVSIDISTPLTLDQGRPVVRNRGRRDVRGVRVVAECLGRGGLGHLVPGQGEQPIEFILERGRGRRDGRRFGERIHGEDVEHFGIDL